MFLEAGQDLRLFGGAVALRHRKVHILGAMELGELRMIGMVADDNRDVSGKFSTAPSIQQILKTVRVL